MTEAHRVVTEERRHEDLREQHQQEMSYLRSELEVRREGFGERQSREQRDTRIYTKAGCSPRQSSDYRHI